MRATGSGPRTPISSPGRAPKPRWRRPGSRWKSGSPTPSDASRSCSAARRWEVDAAATPVPRTLYVHDDLSDEISALGDQSRARGLGEALFARLRRDAERIVILTVAEQIDGLVARGEHAPFAVTVGIGRAGVRVAE